MNDITAFLDLEDSSIVIEDISIIGKQKTITISTNPEARFCPLCGFRMHSRGVRKRRVNHPILQDTYQVVLILKQRRWRCTNELCAREENETFNFIGKRRRNTSASDFLIVNEFRNLNMSASDIARRFNTSDTHALGIFDHYVNMKRLPLSEAVSVDEVHLDIDDNSKYVLVIQNFATGEPIDLLPSRKHNVTEPYFSNLPKEERFAVKYLISDMNNEFIRYVDIYSKCSQDIFVSFAKLLKRHRESIINSFVLFERLGKNGDSIVSRLSNGPIESMNRKFKDLKRIGRGYRNFDHVRNRFLYATRLDPELNGREFKPHEGPHSLRYRNTVPKSRQHILNAELESILEKYNCTKSELLALRHWVSEGNSPFDNPDGMFNEAGLACDFIAASRLLDEIFDDINERRRP